MREIVSTKGRTLRWETVSYPMVLEVVEGTIESRIINLLLETYPATVEDIRRELKVRPSELERALKRLAVRGIVELETLPDRTYVRLLRMDFSFSGLKESQRRRVKHRGKKRERPKDYDGPMFA